eukprot:m.241012 g.241012  ORF g.241012 m.241012 type:complete len:287 (+) comp54411_c0_seq2:3-863(+)
MFRTLVGYVRNRVRDMYASTNEVLNDLFIFETDARSANVVAAELQRLCLGLEGEFMRETGVDYTALIDSQTFKDYVVATHELQKVDLTTLDASQHRAFFLNLYNALTIHTLAHFPKAKSVLEIPNFWGRFMYRIGPHTFTLDEIEHGILRGNRAHPTTGKVFFEGTDERLQFCAPELDPRIHFALVCGAKSCPAVRVYSAANLDRALTMAAKNFCSQEINVDEALKTITLSKILQWYALDFGETQDQQLRHLATYLDDATRASLLTVLEGRYTVVFKAYNWSVNHS